MSTSRTANSECRARVAIACAPPQIPETNPSICLASSSALLGSAVPSGCSRTKKRRCQEGPKFSHSRSMLQGNAAGVRSISPLYLGLSATCLTAGRVVAGARRGDLPDLP